jgi:hypothetical protein
MGVQAAQVNNPGNSGGGGLGGLLGLIGAGLGIVAAPFTGGASLAGTAGILGGDALDAASGTADALSAGDLATAAGSGAADAAGAGASAAGAADGGSGLLAGAKTLGEGASVGSILGRTLIPGQAGATGSKGGSTDDPGIRRLQSGEFQGQMNALQQGYQAAQSLPNGQGQPHMDAILQAANILKQQNGQQGY